MPVAPMAYTAPSVLPAVKALMGLLGGLRLGRQGEDGLQYLQHSRLPDPASGHTGHPWSLRGDLDIPEESM